LLTATLMLLKELWRWNDHAIARLRRMYARLLLVVVGIFGAFLPDFAPFPRELRLGIA
jgi:hypothetical protein